MGLVRVKRIIAPPITALQRFLESRRHYKPPAWIRSEFERYQPVVTAQLERLAREHSECESLQAAVDWLIRYPFIHRGRSHLHYLLDHFGNTPNAGLRILEQGCGDGIFSRILQDLGYDVTAMDVHPELVGLADALGVEKIQIGDGATLRWWDGQITWDFVIALVWPTVYSKQWKDRAKMETEFHEHYQMKLERLRGLRGVWEALLTPTGIVVFDRDRTRYNREVVAEAFAGWQIRFDWHAPSGRELVWVTR